MQKTNIPIHHVYPCVFSQRGTPSSATTRTAQVSYLESTCAYVVQDHEVI